MRCLVYRSKLLVPLPAEQRFLQLPGSIVKIDRLGRVNARSLLSFAELLGQGWNIPDRALGVGGGRVNIPEPMPDAIMGILCAVLLWLALIHQPAVVGCGGQPACPPYLCSFTLVQPDSLRLPL
jgi:hypothetical protein